MSTYPPRQCGVAMFTSNLARVTADREVVALHPAEPQVPYGLEVHHRIQRDERPAYARVARALQACAQVVAVQHDFGIWGGVDGEAVLDFVAALQLPAVATIHDLPDQPTPRQREILTALTCAVQAVVVMSPAAGALLAEDFGVEPGKLEVIPHGVPNLPLVDAATIKPAVELEGRDIILSLGLLEPRKGYEVMIEAMPAIVAARPTATYVIVGATRPEAIARDGEAYRTMLARRVEALRLGGHVRFVDRFVGRVELTRWLESADVFVTPYHDSNSPSGALAYALGAGRAIVSTPYSYAADLLADGRGVIVPFGDPETLATEVVALLAEPERRLAVGSRAYAHGRTMVWTAIGAAYNELFGRLATDAAPAGVGGQATSSARGATIAGRPSR